MEDPHFQPNRWTERLFQTVGRKYEFSGQTGDEFESWQTTFRNDLRKTLGLLVIEEQGVADLAPQHLTTEEQYGYERQKWVIQSEHGLRLPFYLLLPNDRTPPYPVVFAVHGHGHTGKEIYVGRFENDNQRKKIEDGERDIAVQAVKRGYAAIAPDMRGFSELSYAEDHLDGSGSCRTMQMHAQLFGRSLVGDRVWDVQRLIDFVEQHSDLEDRIAITGNSSGGYISLFAAAVDERIDVTVPSSTLCTFEDSIGSLRHCECGYVPGLLRLGEMGEIAGLTAPRPFLAINGQDDEIVPIEGARTAFRRLQEIYDAAGVPENCDLYVGNEGHRYYKDGAWPFIERHLQTDSIH